MTIEDHPRGGAGRGKGLDGERPPMEPRRSTSRDLERYAGLFATRTRVMKSSAMRDLMAITARPEVISFAGGLPDTSTFPPDTFAAVAGRIAAESCAKALQYGPTEGLVETKECIAEAMRADGTPVDIEDMVVTTGGQQGLDLVTKTLIDPGDVVVAEAPTYPGAAPTLSSYHAHAPPPATAADGTRTHLLAEAGAALCSSTLSQLLVQAYFREVRWRDYVASLTEIYRQRRDTMLDALARHFPPQAEFTRPGGGLFIWATLPEFIDTTDLLARCLRDNVAFVPGEQAYLDGRGRNSMRLNFSISDEETIREGVRRIGSVVEELVALYGTLTGSESAVRSPQSAETAPSPEGGQVLRMPERRRR